jgi:hypothetical protein
MTRTLLFLVSNEQFIFPMIKISIIYSLLAAEQFPLETQSFIQMQCDLL